LINTYWKLTELGGQQVITADGKREMKITLRKEAKLTGFAGCNSFFGTYTFDEDKLKFSQIAASRKYCSDSMDMENQFMKAITTVVAYKINGQRLILSDTAGIAAIEFQAVYFK